MVGVVVEGLGEDISGCVGGAQGVQASQKSGTGTRMGID